MRKIIEIDGKKIPFDANGAIPRKYRVLTHRDFLLDMDRLIKTASKGEGYPPEILQSFEDMCHVMAKSADPENVPDTADEWLEQFGTFSIYAVLPEIIELWNVSAAPTVEVKKKVVKKGKVSGH